MRFKSLHPSAALVFYTGLIMLLFASAHPIFIFTLLIGLFCLAVQYAGLLQTARSLRLLLPMALLFGIINPIFVHRGATILFYLFGNPVTLEACAYGAYNAAVLLCVILLFISFNRVIDQAAFLYLTARRMPRTALLINMALHAAIRFQTRAVDIMGVQQSKGLSLQEGGFKARLNTALGLLRAFTVRNLEEGMETAEVLKARDYGTARRTAYRAYPFTARDKGWLIGLTVIITTMIIGLILNGADYLFYPRLQNLLLESGGWIRLSLLVIYVFIPVLYEFYGVITRRLR